MYHVRAIFVHLCGGWLVTNSHLETLLDGKRTTQYLLSLNHVAGN